MPRTLQVLIGAACLVIIVAGGWIGFRQYAARAEAKRLEAYSSQMDDRRQASQCNELMKRPNEMSDLLWDMCVMIKQRVREAK